MSEKPATDLFVRDRLRRARSSNQAHRSDARATKTTTTRQDNTARYNVYVHNDLSTHVAVVPTTTLVHFTDTNQ